MRRSIVGMAVLSIATLSPGLAKADRRTDQEIANKVQQGLLDLKDRGDLRGFSIDLEVDDATVWLKGHVSTAEQEKLTLEMARYIPGVKQVVDDLKVAKSTPTTATAAEAPSPTLAEKPVEPARMPNVLDGLKKLSPFAKRDTQVKPATEESASDVKSDSEIAKEIIGKLQAKKDEGELRGFNLDLRVNDGDVLLDGHVRDQGQHDQVIEIARRVTGVKQVVDGIRIAGTPVAATPASTIAPSQAPQAAGGQPQARPLQPQAPYYADTQEAYAQYAQAYARYAQAYAQARQVNYNNNNTPLPMGNGAAMVAPARFDHPQLPGYSWPSYAAHPNYAAVTYPKQYSPSAWPYIGPFYPYPQVPLGWRKVTLQWDDGWWFLDFKDK